MDLLPSYVMEPVAGRGARRGRLALCAALGLILVAASLVAVGARNGGRHRLPVVQIHPGNGGCAVPYTRSGTDGAGITTTMNLCISQEGNITSLFYPDTNAGHQQISFDAYCLSHHPAAGGPYTLAADFGGAAGAPASFGFGPATISQPKRGQQQPDHRHPQHQ